jgi:hypothetical protein
MHIHTHTYTHNRAALASWFLRDAHDLHSFFTSIHESKNACTPEGAIVFTYNDQGIGAKIADFAVEFSFAVRNHRAAVFTGEWIHGI